MGLTLITAPTVRAILLEELKDHLRIVGEDDLAYVDMMISAVMARVDGKEGILNRAILTLTWDLTLDDFPAADHISIPLPPLAVCDVDHIHGHGRRQPDMGGVELYGHHRPLAGPRGAWLPENLSGDAEHSKRRHGAVCGRLWRQVGTTCRLRYGLP